MYSGVGLLLRWWCWFCGGGVGIRGNLPFLQVVLLFPRRWLRWYIYCPAFMIVEKVVLYICIFGHHGHSTNIHYWSELGTLRTLASGSELGPF